MEWEEVRVRWGEERWGEVRRGAHVGSTIDYVRKIYELLMASPSAWNGLEKLLPLSCTSQLGPDIFVSTTNNTKYAYIKRVILQEKEDKIRIQGHFKFIRSLLSCYSYRSHIFGEALSLSLLRYLLLRQVLTSPHLSPSLYWLVRYAINNTLETWMNVFNMARFDPFNLFPSCFFSSNLLFSPPLLLSSLYSLI